MGQPSSVLSSPASPTSQYRRQARHLRWTHRRDPAGLQRALRQLSRSTSDTPSGQHDWSGSAVLGTRDGQAWKFADRVAAALDGSILSYSNRRKLLKQAEQMKIGRFEANLIIAAVQNHLDLITPPPAKNRRARLWPAVAVCLALEVIAGCVVWRLLG
jgi:hypothetical protein